jgi:dimethylglycine dehydrogenase
MKTQARVVVIGGGVVGVGTLYHLAKKGWRDVVLCERTELTAGSTWHAAGLLPLFNMSYSVGQIHKYSVKLYKTLEQETGQPVGFAVVGNLRLATNRDRMDEYHHYAGTARTIGVDVEFLTPSEIKEMVPFCNTEGLIGGILHPEDGYIQSADVTMAMAKGARDRGAEIYQHTPVTGIERKSNGEWLVKTANGDITCEHVVSATGNYARETGRMVGLDIPSIPVQHQFIVTDSHPLLEQRKKDGLREMPVLRESDASYYLREERQGLLLGPYEKGAPACFVDGVPSTFEKDLFPGDLDRLEPHIEAAINRVPIFGEAGVKEVINGPIAYTPDGSPLIGPAWGLKNFWINEGHSFGITAAAGAGWQLAEWIVEGQPTIDMLGVDPRRYGDYASKAYLKTKNEEAYENVFIIHFHDEERPGARPLKTAPCYDRMKALGAVFGQKFGWERPNWFAPQGVPQEDDWSFRRSRYFEHVGNECRNVHENVGLLDMTAFSKFTVTGPGAEAYLDKLVANRIPKKLGRVNLCHALNIFGGVRSEFTVMRDGPEAFYARWAGGLLLGLRRRPGALRLGLPVQDSARGRQRAPRQDHDPGGRAGGRGTEVARAPVAGDRCRSVQPGVPLADRQVRRRRPGALPAGAGQLRRRAGLGDPPSPGDAEPYLRRADGGRRGPGVQALRHPRHGRAQDREVLPPGRHRAVHRVRRPRVRAAALRPSQQG